MKLTTILQILILLAIMTLLSVFYYYFKEQKSIDDDISKNIIFEKSKDNELNIEKNVNKLINIEYSSYDEDGNTYYVIAQEAKINTKNDQKNIVELFKVISIINIKNKGEIYIYSENATYNEINFNTSFYNNNRIEFMDNIITSQNLDLIFTEKISKIYNNVYFKNNKAKLNTDKILIDMLTGDIKMEMLKNGDKVNFSTKL